MAIFTEITKNEYVYERQPCIKGDNETTAGYCAMNGKRCKTECQLVLFTDMKSHMVF